MMRTTSCSIIISYILPRRQVSQTPTCIVQSLWFEHQNALLYIRMHTKWLSQWHPKVIPSVLKHDLSDQSLHPTYHCIRFRPPLLHWAILSPHKNHPTPNLMHWYWSFTIVRFSTLKDTRRLANLMLWWLCVHIAYCRGISLVWIVDLGMDPCHPCNRLKWQLFSKTKRKKKKSSDWHSQPEARSNLSMMITSS